MGEDFLLDTETARRLFREGAQNTPIFDWHCHLSPKEIYENREPEDIAALWLGGDHYKWRAMRSYGIEEQYITGDASGYEKFKAYASMMPACIGNPLYHWSHLELRRYFGIEETLSDKTADTIWHRANERIHAGGFTPRGLIEKSNVAALCTTDDPADTLEYHQLLKAAILHALQHLVKALLNGGIGQHYRLSGAVLGRLRHLGQADIVLFHFLTPLVIDFLYLACGRFQILSMGYMGRMICLKGMIRVSCGVAPCVRDMTENAAFSFSSGKI